MRACGMDGSNELLGQCQVALTTAATPSTAHAGASSRAATWYGQSTTRRHQHIINRTGLQCLAVNSARHKVQGATIASDKP